MNKQTLIGAVACISEKMRENKQYLIELDAKFGDGDLGISMVSGFSAVCEFLDETPETDLGVILMKCATVFNKTSPSSLGTILSFGFMGAAKYCKGQTKLTPAQTVEAMEKALENMMTKAQSKPGEKTILDALVPGVEALSAWCYDNKNDELVSDTNSSFAYQKAYEAAEAGMLSTKDMLSVHGRAAYYGEKVIGHIDGGAVVGKLIFEGLRDYYT